VQRIDQNRLWCFQISTHHWFKSSIDVLSCESFDMLLTIAVWTEQSMVDLLGLREPKIARFIWTLINGVLIEQVGNEALSFAEQIDLLTQMLTAYFEKNRTLIR
jgi:hypothetical protein